MPITVNMQGRDYEFPDGTSQEEMRSALMSEFNKSKEPDPAAVDIDSDIDIAPEPEVEAQPSVGTSTRPLIGRGQESPIPPDQALAQRISEKVGPMIPGPIKAVKRFADQVSFGAIDALNDIGDILGAPKQQELPEGSDPTGIVEKAGRVTGELVGADVALGPLGGFSKAAKVGANVMKSPAIMAKVQRVKNFVEPIATFAKKSVGETVNILSGIPREFVERAVEKPDVLAGKFDNKKFRQMGKKAQDAVNFVSRQEGKAIVKEAQELRKIKGRLDVSEQIGFLNNAKTKAEAGERVGTSLTKADLKKIDEISDKLLDIATDPEPGKAGATPFELHTIKKQIDNLVRFDQEAVSKPSPAGEAILKGVRDQINTTLRNISPGYAKANDNFSKVASMKKNLIPRLKEARLEKNISNVMRQEDPFIRNSLKEVDELLPENKKFYEDLFDLATRKEFDPLFPKGQGALLKAAAIGGAGLGLGVSPGVGIAATAVQSPAVQRRLIGTAAGAARLAPKVGARALIRRSTRNKEEER